jgi:sugar lactone lactonase YvrE
MSRRILALAASLVALTAGLATPAQADTAFPTRIELPNGFRPEGIAIRHITAYTGSLADGDIYAADLRTGTGERIIEGPGTPSVGLKADFRGRLFVAGGVAGTGRVYDLRTRTLLKNYTFTTSATTFVNDVVLTPRAAWFTDSRQPQLYRVAIGRDGRLADQAVTVPLSGEYQHMPNVNNANGIARTPDGRALLIVQSATGTIFRVDPRTGATRKVDLGGAVMTNGDGLLVIGRTLYVVQNRLNKIAVIELDRAATAGRVVREITSPDFDVPTTVAAFGNRLYLPNARFTTTPTPDTPYWISAVTR